MPIATAAGIMRHIAHRSGLNRALPARTYAFVCRICEVGWSGTEADCWSCGHRASSVHTSPTSALHRLLHPAPAPSARGATR